MIEDEFITIEQCLFGYSDGHRLLSSSMILNESVLGELLRRSDTPFDTISSFNEYHYSGYPLISEKVYVLIKTWPALEMNRPGCVWSHVLFIKFSDFERINNLCILDGYFKRPNSNLSVYGDSIKVYNYSLSGDDFDVEESKFHEVIKAIYSSQYGSKIIYTISPESYMKEVYRAWSLQWPRLRRSFSFSVASSNTGTIKDVIRKNDIVFFYDYINAFEQSSSINDDWQEMLLFWMKHKPADLKGFLWDIGRLIKGGRFKFSYLIYLFNEIQVVKSNISLYSEVFKVIELIKKVFDVRSEVVGVIDKVFGMLSGEVCDIQLSIYYSASILSVFNSNENLIPKEICNEVRENLYSNKDKRFDVNCLLNDVLVNKRSSLPKAAIHYTPLDDIPIETYSLRSLDFICEIKKGILLRDAIYDYSFHFVMYLSRKYWYRFTSEEKKFFINKTWPHHSHYLVKYINKIDTSDALRLLIFNGFPFECHDAKIMRILTSFTINNLIEAQRYAADYNVMSKLLNAYNYNEYIIDLIPVGVIEKSLTGHVNTLQEFDMFNFYSFVYYKCYFSDGVEYTPLLLFSFVKLHQMLSNNVCHSMGWSIISPTLPATSIFKSWDKCYTLRSSLIKRYRTEYALQHIIYALGKEDEKLSWLIKKECDDIFF